MLVFGESLTWRIGAGGILILLSILAVTWLHKPDSEQ
jgi:drug/metabolite transporter (DMT)-like permease